MSGRKQTWSFQQASLGRSFIWSLAITTLPVASGFAVSWVTARFAGPRTLGTVSWGMSFATALLIWGKFGLDLAASRMASEYGVRQPGVLRSLFRTALGLRMLFTLSVAVPAFVFANQIALFFNDMALADPVRVSALIVLCASLYEFEENFIVGLNRLRTVYIVRSVHLLLRVVFTSVLVFLGFHATQILGGYAAAWMVGILAFMILLFRYLPKADDADNAGAGEVRGQLLAMAVPLAISSASVTIYSHMDRLMLGYFSGVEEVGQYAVARNITEVSLFPAFAMVMMLRPALASRVSGDRMSECAGIIRGSLRFNLVSGVLFAALFAALGVPLVRLIFSDQFTYAGQLMLFFVVIIALRAVGSVIVPALVAAERMRTYAVLTTVSAVVNFGLNVVLIPRYQARGAIVATALSYGILLIIGLREVFVTYGIRPGAVAASVVARTILAGAGAALTIWLAVDQSNMGWESILWALLLSAIYLTLIVIFRVTGPGDARGLLANLRKSNE